MKLYEIHVKERAPGNAFSTFTFEEVSLEVGEPLAYRDKLYWMSEYKRNEKEKLLRIGVHAPAAASVMIVGEDGNAFLIPSKTKPGYWYEQARGWIEEGFVRKSDSCFGMNACGQWKVRALDEKGAILEEENVIVKPRNMTYSQYQAMKAEVKSLFEKLSYHPEEGSMLKELQVSLFPLAKLMDLIVEMESWLGQIMDNPGETLTRTREKTRRSQITKWDSATFIEASLFPFRESLSAQVTIKDTDIDEHRMVRSMLESVRDRLKQEWLYEKTAVQHLYSERTARTESLKGMSGKLKEYAQRRVQSIQSDIDLVEERQQDWKKGMDIIEALLSEPLFDVDPMEPELTHLFSHDPVYGTVYALYEQFQALEPALEPIEKDFIEHIISSPKLYEIWMLMQIIHQLGRLQFSTAGIRDSLLSHFTQNQTVSGWRYRFPYDRERGEMFLYYELEYKDEIGKLKPDYLLLYRREKDDSWQGHSLDAKYKPYTENPPALLQHDIERSGRRYIQRLAGNALVMKSASLVHIDVNATNWNVAGGGVYEFSHFSVQPGKLDNLQIYLKRILHYFGGNHSICPSCGEKTEMIDGGFKHTYLCENDNEVWVSSICKYRRTHPFPYQNLDLMKYASANYNQQVQQEWDVHCPVCLKDFKGNVANQDVFGLEIKN